MKVYGRGMHIFEVTFDDGTYEPQSFLVKADNILEAAKEIPRQDWNQDINFAVKIVLLEIGL